MNTEKMITPSKNKEKSKRYKRWEKSVRNGDTEKSICVEEAENGFVIRITDVDLKEGWDSNTKIYVSNTNPLEKESPIETGNSSKEINEALTEFENFFG